MGDSGSAGFHCTVGLMREGEPQEEAQNQPSGAVLPLSRRAHAEQLAQNQAQVERADMNQLPLQNVLPSSQVAAPHAARFIAMREAAFHQLAAPPEQALAVAASHPPPVLIDRLLFLGLALPVAPPLLPLLECNCALGNSSRAGPLRRCGSPCRTETQGQTKRNPTRRAARQ